MLNIYNRVYHFFKPSINIRQNPIVKEPPITELKINTSYDINKIYAQIQTKIAMQKQEKLNVILNTSKHINDYSITAINALYRELFDMLTIKIEKRLLDNTEKIFPLTFSFPMETISINYWKHYHNIDPYLTILKNIIALDIDYIDNIKNSKFYLTLIEHYKNITIDSLKFNYASSCKESENEYGERYQMTTIEEKLYLTITVMAN